MEKGGAVAERVAATSRETRLLAVTAMNARFGLRGTDNIQNQIFHNAPFVIVHLCIPPPEMGDPEIGGNGVVAAFAHMPVDVDAQPVEQPVVLRVGIESQASLRFAPSLGLFNQTQGIEDEKAARELEKTPCPRDEIRLFYRQVHHQ